VTSSSLSVHVDFVTRITAKRSLSLLTMQSGYTDRLTLVNYIFHHTQLSFPYTVMTTSLLAQVLRKTFLSLRFCKYVKVCTLPDIYIRLKMCAEMTEEAQVHYVRTIVAIPIPIQEHPEYRLLKRTKVFLF